MKRDFEEESLGQSITWKVETTNMVEEAQQSRGRSYPASCDRVLLDLPPFAELPSHELTLLPITLVPPSK